MPLGGTVSLKSVPAGRFDVSVSLFKPGKARKGKNGKMGIQKTACPGAVPAWVTTLKNNGGQLDLLGIFTQAGRHFDRKMNPAKLGVSSGRRQFANEMAWYLASVLEPTVAAGQLVLSRPDDKDLQSLAMELMGVGAGLELLRKHGALDARTIRKVGGSFDFSGRERGAATRFLIEVKGTLDDVSLQKHQGSSYKKLSGLAARGYSHAVAVIFRGWTAAPKRPRRYDFQLMDPELEHPDEEPEGPIRDAISFYAQQYHTAGMPGAAERLWRLAELEGELPRVPAAEFVSSGIDPNGFGRVRQTLVIGGRTTTFWGSFWRSSYIPPILGVDVEGLEFAFVGVDSRIMLALRRGDYDAVVDYQFHEQLYEFRTRAPDIHANGRDSDYRGADACTGCPLREKSATCTVKKK